MASNLRTCPFSLDSSKGTEWRGGAEGCWNSLSTEHIWDTQPNILHLASH